MARKISSIRVGCRPSTEVTAAGSPVGLRYTTAGSGSHSPEAIRLPGHHHPTGCLLRVVGLQPLSQIALPCAR